MNNHFNIFIGDSDQYMYLLFFDKKQQGDSYYYVPLNGILNFTNLNDTDNGTVPYHLYSHVYKEGTTDR